MSQKAIYLTKIGAPLVLSQRPIPEAGENELLVKITSAGINPHDSKSRELGLFVETLPYIPAHDIAGEVIGRGAGSISQNFSVGDHIFAQSRIPEGYILNDFHALQQYALVDAKYAAKVKETGLSDDEAATIPVNGPTAFVALFHETGSGVPLHGDLSGQSLLVIGGGSNCGRYVVQFAKIAGFGKIIAVAGPNSHAELKKIGATHVIDRHAGDVVAQVRHIVNDDLIYAIDAVNEGAHQVLGVSALSNTRQGTLITLTPAVDQLDPAKIGQKEKGYNRRWITGRCAVHSDEFFDQFWGNIAPWLREKKVLPSKYTVIEGLDADAINHVLDLYCEGKGYKVQVHP